MKQLEELLDYYAVEYYGEFGYDTLSSEEKKVVLELAVKELFKT